MPLAGREAALRITSQAATTSTGVAATRASNGLSVQITSTAFRHLDPDSTPVLYRNSTAVSPTLYSVNFVQGKFVFTAAQSTGTYTADIEYNTASSVAGGREWSLNVEQEAFEVTEFGSSGWRQFQPNLAGATATIARYWNDVNFFDVIIADNPKFVVELVVNSAQGWKYEGFARIAQDQINTAVDAIVNESINLTIDGELYFSTE